MTLPIATPDLIEFENERIDFNLLSNDSDAYKIIEVNYKSNHPDPEKQWIRYPASTSIRKIPYFGTIVVRTDGVGYFIPNSNTPDELMLRYTITNWKSGTAQTEVILKRKVDTPPVEVPNEPYYKWGILGNTGVTSGAEKLRGLRSPTGLAELNGYIYVSTGFCEGNSSIFKLKFSDLTRRIEVDKPINNGFVMEVVSMVHDENYIYALGFDPYGYDSDNGYSSKIDCAIVVYDKNDQQVKFDFGKSIRCTFQDVTAPYKSLIGVYQNDTTKRPKKIYKEGNYLVIVHVDGSKSTVNLSNGQMIRGKYEYHYIHQHEGVVMGYFGVYYNDNIIANAQTSPNIDEYTYRHYDFTNNEMKGSVMEQSDGTVWVVDAGNSIVRHYTADGVHIEWFMYTPMNYNVSVDKNVPQNVFIGGVQLRVEYPSMDFKVVANRNYFLNDVYLPKDNRYNFIRCPFKLYGLIDRIKIVDGQDQRIPTIYDFISNDAAHEFDAFANVHIDKHGNEWELKQALKVGEFAEVWKNGTLQYKVQTTKESALPISNAFISVTEDEHVVVFNPSVAHNQNHLSWLKDGKIVANAMPSVVGTDGIYPEGDCFDIGNNVEYGGADRVVTIGNRVYVMYIGEFFGGAGGQTTIIFVYQLIDGVPKLLMRVGRPYKNEECPPEFAGNAKAIDGVRVDGVDYLFANCEHTGSIHYWAFHGFN